MAFGILSAMQKPPVQKVLNYFIIVHCIPLLGDMLLILAEVLVVVCSIKTGAQLPGFKCATPTNLTNMWTYKNAIEDT